MRIVNVLLALFMSLALGVFALEGGLRAIGKGPPEPLLEHDEFTGWRKRTKVSVERSGPEFDVRITTNEQGLVDDPMPDPRKPAGAFRVLVLGDSFTQGFTVGRDDLYVDLLERRWVAQGRAADIVNAGTEGWSTDQEVAWFLRHGAKFEPDVVLIAAYENDLYWNGQSRYVQRSTPKPLFRADGTLAVERCEDIGPEPWTQRFAIPRAASALWSPAELPEEFLFQPSGALRPISREFAPLLNERAPFLAPCVDGTAGALIALRRECERIGAKPVLLAIPSHSSVDPAYAARFAELALGGIPKERWAPDSAIELMIKLSQALGIPALDPRTALRAAQREDAQYFEIDWHLNANGNRTLAAFLHDELDRTGLVPAKYAAQRPVEPERVAAARGTDWRFVGLLYLGLLTLLSTLFIATYPEERRVLVPFKIGALLALVFTLFLGAGKLHGFLPSAIAGWAVPGLVAILLAFVVWKLGRRVGTIAELLRCFTLRGHWYLMPLLVVLLTVGSLLVVAASSPLIAPFIYTLF